MQIEKVKQKANVIHDQLFNAVISNTSKIKRCEAYSNSELEFIDRDKK